MMTFFKGTHRHLGKLAIAQQPNNIFENEYIKTTENPRHFFLESNCFLALFYSISQSCVQHLEVVKYSKTAFLISTFFFFAVLMAMSQRKNLTRRY